MLSQKIRSLLKKYNLKILKQLGQHFLIDKKVLNRIVNAAQLTKKDVVLEIGPGLGVLTEALAKKVGKVIAVEIDRGMVKYLKRKFKNKDYENIEIVHQDVLSYKLQIMNCKVVANLPYHITSRVIRHFLEAKIKPNLMVLLVQKEVAKRIVAQPGQMSLLSCSVQFYGQPEIIDFVPKESFWPEPEVESAILRIKVYKKPKIKVKNRKIFFQIIKAGFSSKRKQLHNALAGGLQITNEEAKNLLEKSGIDPARRAQTLSLSEWAKLAKLSTS
jgi:16S rRNA (adenine1518-N6/adenine1519-N6)-dimethyltransferase